jgi:hypothetical protein
MFRTLRADEIDCRISQVKKDGSGLSLLLYKDARCDQNILDETVTPMKWKREHTRDNRNCIVSIWSEELKQWVSKEDTGTESNTEREKGLASDSFKRACFNWGIGRELYSAPFIWIKRGDFTFKDGKCYDRFTVKGIGYTNGVITGLEIMNQALNRIVYSWGKITEEAPEKPEQPDTDPDGTRAPEFTPPPAANNVRVSTTDRVPPLPNEGEKKPPEPSPVTVYLLGAMKELREIRRISPAQNNKLFAAQKEALIAEGLAPKKDLAEYTMEEAKALIEAMYQKFSPEGTDIKK